MITGKTALAVMLGHPVGQVRTPAAFNAWAEGEGVDAVMIALDVPPAGLQATLEAIARWENCVGAVVTYPHKQAVLTALETATDEVRVVGAANVIRRAADGGLHGGMTDGLGFVAALRARGMDPRGVDARVVGAGGAGSAIALALVDAGVGRLMIDDIDAARRATLLACLSEARPGSIAMDTEPPGFTCALIVNATPVGMAGDLRHPYPLDRLPPGCHVADIVPTPAETPWLIEAQRRGHPIQTGPEMVACQLPAVVAHLMPEHSAKRAV
jgi:shikimate dehydrogenase